MGTKTVGEGKNKSINIIIIIFIISDLIQKCYNSVSVLLVNNNILVIL